MEKIQRNCVWNFSNMPGYFRNRNKIERNIILQQYKNYCNFDGNRINFCLENCNNGAIVLDQEGTLKSFALWNILHKEKIYEIYIIDGEDNSLNLILNFLREKTKKRCINQLIICSSIERAIFFERNEFEIYEYSENFVKMVDKNKY